MKPIDWDKPLVHKYYGKVTLIAEDPVHRKFIVRYDDKRGTWREGMYQAFDCNGQYRGMQCLSNVVEDTVIWVWKVRINEGLRGEDTQVGWSWSEREARDYAGNSLLSLQKVTLKEGEGNARTV